MAPNRFPLSILMLAIAALAVGLGAMRSGSEIAERLALAVLILSILVGLLGSIVRRGEAAWVGFALFAGSYTLLAFLPIFQGGYNRQINPATGLVESLADALHPGPGVVPAAPVFNPQFESMIGDRQHLTRVGIGPGMNSTLLGLLSPAEVTKLKAYQDTMGNYQATVISFGVARDYAREIGHAMFALVFGFVGATIGRALERPRPIVPEVESPGEGGRA